VEAFADGEWNVVSRGTTIGRTKVDRFAAVVAERVRVVVEASAGPGRVETVGAYGAVA
jgi:hypothetical protein